MSKNIDSLVQDMYGVFLNSKHEINDANLTELGDTVKEVVKKSIEKATERRTPTLRMSVIGKPDRQLWYDIHSHNPDEVIEVGDIDVFEPEPHKFIRFLYGDIVEALMVFLVKESGHTITHQQEEFDINGVKGHTDGVIDGVPMDIKSASGYSFTQKFKLGGLLRKQPDSDPFGYVAQLSAYQEQLIEKYPDEIDQDRVAWLVMNKETGELTLLTAHSMDLINAEDRITHLQAVIARDEPPAAKCYVPEAAGTSGNMKLAKGCIFCPHKDKCWEDANDGNGLRKFSYAGGKTEYLTKVVKVPRVDEIA